MKYSKLAYCRIDNLVQAGVGNRQAASRYLKLLVEIGIQEERVSGREKLFLNNQLLQLLAERSIEGDPENHGFRILFRTLQPTGYQIESLPRLREAILFYPVKKC